MANPVREGKLAREYGILGPSDISDLWEAVGEARYINDELNHREDQAYLNARWASPEWRSCKI